MKTLQVIVQKAGKGVSAHLPEVDGYVISRPTFEKLKKDIRSGLQFHIEGAIPGRTCRVDGWRFWICVSI